MKPRHKRMIWIAVGLAVLAGAAGLVLNAFKENLVFFFTPTQIASGEAPQGRAFRVGGLVEPGSLKRDPAGAGGSFRITDNAKTIDVRYTGILPDLFKEGAGVVAQGTVMADGTFAAREVLAKHDENYMPPEAAQALSQAAARRSEGAAAPGSP